MKNNILYKWEKIKFIIIISILLIIFLSVAILLPFTETIKFKYYLIGEIFMITVSLISIIALLILIFIIKIINIDIKEDKFILNDKEILFKDIKEINIASHLIFGSYLKVDCDIEPIYEIVTDDLIVYISISHKDLSKIKNNVIKDMINNLYIDKASHKKLTKESKKNTKYYFKNINYRH